jgi:two-component SAPR family response regulator
MSVPNVTAAKKRVLVVEDDYLIARDLGHMLRRLGFAVVGPFPDLAAAFAGLEAEPPDLALLDIDLRDTPVFPLAEELERRGIPVVFCTGYDHRILPPAMHRIRRITKPVVAADLAKALSYVRRE